jgi:hypothetical protein
MGTTAVGVGRTVMVKFLGSPVQVIPPCVKEGVMVMVAWIVVFPMLIALKAGMELVPFAVKPMEVLSFVQE